jgi:hypothetical protein
VGNLVLWLRSCLFASLVHEACAEINSWFIHAFPLFRGSWFHVYYSNFIPTGLFREFYLTHVQLTNFQLNVLATILANMLANFRAKLFGNSDLPFKEQKKWEIWS